MALITTAVISIAGLGKAPPSVTIEPPHTGAAPGGSGATAGGSPNPSSLPDPPRGALLACIRWWESRNNYRAISRGGRYRNAYQFDWPTWAGVGGSGDPALATPAEQDYRAALLVGLFVFLLGRGKDGP